MFLQLSFPDALSSHYFAYGNGKERSYQSYQVCVLYTQTKTYYNNISSVYIQTYHCVWCLHSDVYQVRSPNYERHTTNFDFFSGFIFNSSLYYLPQFFQVALGYSPIRSGVFLLPVLVSQTIASFIAVIFLICPDGK